MAANSILKLKVDNTEYDANIKKAAEGIQHLAKRMHDAQGDFEGLDKASLDFIKDLQYMTTSAKTASGQYRELENAYKNLAATYEGLNAFEKEGDAGKALAEQLEILKNRTLDMKANMDAASKSLQTNATEGQEDSSVLSKLADKLTVNVDALKLFNWGLQAADGALKVAKDAFFSSEQNVDEWGRIMASSQSLYEGFVTSLNNSDFTGFMSHIDDIVKAAREAYNELDRLGTMKTIQAPQIERQNSENVRMRTMLMTGRYIAPSDGRAPLQGMKTGDLLSPAQIKTLERQLQGGMNTIVKLTQNELDQTGRAIDAYYNKLAKENGMTMEEFKKGTSSMAEFDQRQEGYRKYQQWRQENSFTDMYGYPQVREGNPYQEFKKWGTFRVDEMGENSYNDLVGLIRQQQQQQSQIYSTIGQAYRTINRAEGVTVKGLMNPGGGGGRSGSGGGKTTSQYIPLDGSIDDQIKKVQELQKVWRAAADDDSRKKIKKQIEQAQLVLDVLNGKTDVKDVEIRVNSDEALKAVENIEGVKIDPKSFTVTADDDKSAEELKKLGAVQINDKTFSITANDADVLKNIQDIEGVKIDPKDVTIKADTSEALAKIQDIKNIDISISSHSLPGLENELKELNEQRKLLSDPIEIELIDNQIKEVKDEIDQLNGKKVEIEIVPSTLTPFEKLRDSLKIEIAEENMQVDTTTLQTLMKTAIQNGIDGLDPNFSALQEKMREGMNIPDETWQTLQDEINEKLKELGIEPIKIDFKTGNLAKDGKDTEASWKAAAQAVQSVGGAMQSIEDPAAKVAGTIAQAIASIALGYAQATTQAATLGPWAWVAFAATGMAQMISMISAIHSSTGYANGGIVKGNSYSGDNIPAMVGGPSGELVGLNAGEVVLNKAAQSNLANQLQGNNMSNMRLVARVKGTDLLFSLENTLQMQGYGKIATWG